MSLKNYIHALTGRVFKLLTIKEKETCGVVAYLSDYIDSLIIDMTGALSTFPALGDDVNYITVVNIVNYLKDNDIQYKQYKREVFKALKLLNGIEDSVGDRNDELEYI